MIKKAFWFFTLLGLAVSLYLTYAYVIAHRIACIGGGCEIVASSPYSRIFGIPQPIMGIVFYTSLILLYIARDLRKFIPLIVSIGAIYSVYLTWVEVSILHAICMWCMISAICTWALFFITLVYEDF